MLLIRIAFSFLNALDYKLCAVIDVAFPTRREGQRLLDQKHSRQQKVVTGKSPRHMAIVGVWQSKWQTKRRNAALSLRNSYETSTSSAGQSCGRRCIALLSARASRRDYFIRRTRTFSWGGQLSLRKEQAGSCHCFWKRKRFTWRIQNSTRRIFAWTVGCWRTRFFFWRIRARGGGKPIRGALIRSFMGAGIREVAQSWLLVR